MPPKRSFQRAARLACSGTARYKEVRNTTEAHMVSGAISFSADSLTPEADQDARFGSNAAGSGSSAQGYSFRYVVLVQTHPPQGEFPFSPLSPGGCRMGPGPQDSIRSFPSTRLWSQPPPVVIPARLPRVVALLCSFSPEQNGFSFPSPQQLPPDGSVYTVGPPNTQGFGQQQASVSLLTTQHTLKDPGAEGIESGTIPVPYSEGSALCRAVGQAGIVSSPAGPEASKGQMYTVRNLEGCMGQAYLGSPQAAPQAVEHDNTYVSGATERGSLPPPALQGFPPCSSPDIQQLPQAGSLFSPGCPPRALGQTSSPQGPASSSSGAHSAPRAPHPGPFLPQAPAGPRGLQPPPPGQKAQKSPSPGPAALPDPGQIPPPAGPPAALPTRTPTLQRPPDVPPKASKLPANQEAAMKRSSNANSKDSKQESTECIIGEMVSQLANRIHCTIFPGWGNVYGITVDNIPKKVIESGSDPYSLPNGMHTSAIEERVNTILSCLKPWGYEPRERPPEAASSDDLRGLWDMVKETATPELRNDCLGLLNCLEQLSQEEGKPLFCW